MKKRQKVKNARGKTSRKTKEKDKIMGLLTKLADQVRDSKDIEKSVLEQINKLPERIKITPVQVISAVPLTKEELNEVENNLVFLIGEQVIIKNLVQKDILGGLKIVIGTKIIDSSIAGQLSQLQMRFNKLIKR